MTMLKPCKFSFDCSPVFEGFALGTYWNGFDNVAVTRQELEKIINWIESDEGDDYGFREILAGKPLIEVREGTEVIPLYSLANGFATQIVH